VDGQQQGVFAVNCSKTLDLESTIAGFLQSICVVIRNPQVTLRQSSTLHGQVDDLVLCMESLVISFGDMCAWWNATCSL